MMASTRWGLLVLMLAAVSGCASPQVSITRWWSRDKNLQTAEIDKSPGSKSSKTKPKAGTSKDAESLASRDSKERTSKDKSRDASERWLADNDDDEKFDSKKYPKGTSISDRPYRDSGKSTKTARRGDDPFPQDEPLPRDRSSKSVAANDSRSKIERGAYRDDLNDSRGVSQTRGERRDGKSVNRLDDDADDSPSGNSEIRDFLRNSDRDKGTADKSGSGKAYRSKSTEFADSATSERGTSGSRSKSIPLDDEEFSPRNKSTGTASTTKKNSRWDDLEVREEPDFSTSKQKTIAKDETVSTAKGKGSRAIDDDDVFAAPPSRKIAKRDPLEEEQDVAPPPPGRRMIPAANSSSVKALATEDSPAVAKSPLVRKCPGLQGEAREIVASLDNSDVESLKRQLNRLGQLDEQAAAAAPAVRDFLGHRDPFVRIFAGLTLFRLQQLDDSVLDMLEKSLQAKDSAVRAFSAAVLAEMGPAADPLVPVMVKALNDSDVQVRLHVAKVLSQSPTYSRKAIDVLKGCLADADPTVRWLATYAVADVAPQQLDVVAVLTKMLRDPEKQVRMGAVYALGSIGPIAAPSVPELQIMATDPDEELRTAANRVLPQIQSGRPIR